jgi:hypothetical protein
MITLNGDTGITTPGLINTGSTTLINLTTTGNTILGDQSTDTLNVANGNLVLNSSGNLGIGTTTPAQKLTIASAGVARFYRSDNTRFGDIYVDGDGFHFKAQSTGDDVWIESPNVIKLYTAGTERARIDSSGNLAIGATSAASRLYVESTNTPQVVFRNPAGASYTSLRLYNDVNSSARALEIDYFGSTAGGGERAEIFVTGAYPLLFGTSNAERARIDTSGNLSVGTTGIASSGQSSGITTNSVVAVKGPLQSHTTAAGIFEYNSNKTSIRAYGATAGSGYIAFGVGGGGGSADSTAVTIDSSGNFIVGKTSTDVSTNGWVLNPNGGGQTFTISSGTNEAFTWNNVSTGGTAQLDFRTANSEKGNISWNNSSTSYNTASDYRLKENIAPMTGALARIAQLKPVTYTWKADGSAGEGFIAHELAEVVSQAVTGEKDAVREDGITPRYQGVDASFLVATLTAAIQELKAELDSVKSELATIKGAA